MQSGQVAIEKHWSELKTNADVNTVLTGEIFILISFNVKALIQVNSQQMLMDFKRFLSSPHVNCVIWILNFNLDAVIST